jgi:hypothetical protein
VFRRVRIEKNGGMNGIPRQVFLTGFFIYLLVSVACLFEKIGMAIPW